MTEALFEIPKTEDGGLSTAAAATIQALRDKDLIQPEHELACALLVQVAQRAGVGLQHPKTTIATTNLVRLLLDIINQLPEAVETGGDAWDEFAAHLASIEANTFA